MLRNHEKCARMDIDFLMLSAYDEFVSGGIQMLNFEEELKKFKPCLEVEELEDAVYQEDLTDMTDILKEVMQKQ